MGMTWARVTGSSMSWRGARGAWWQGFRVAGLQCEQVGAPRGHHAAGWVPVVVWRVLRVAN
jgi:hypothetical protein